MHVSKISSYALKLTQTRPLAQLLSVRHLDQGDLVFRAQSNDELLVCFFLAGLVEDAHVCLTTIESLGGFAETTSKTVMDEGDLEASFQSVEDGHLALACGGITADFDFLRLGDWGGWLFSVRLTLLVT